MAKIDASSAPRTLPGASAMKKLTVIERKPRIGTDWRMSRIGMRSSSARRLRAATVP
jgi:hypothetical protein